MAFDDFDDLEPGSVGYEDAHRLASVVKSGATLVLGAACVLGGLHVLFGMYMLYDGGPGSFTAGFVSVFIGLLDALAGYAISILLRGLASIVSATADTAQSTAKTVQALEGVVQGLEQQGAIQKQMLAQLVASSAKTRNA